MKITHFMDSDGFIGHYSLNGEWDFGDSLQRTATIYLEKYLRYPTLRHLNGKFFAKMIRQCSIVEAGEVQYVRHPDSTHWWGQPWTMSRDNLTTAHDVLALYAPYNSEAAFEWERMTELIVGRGGILWNRRHIWPKPGDKLKLIPDIIWPWDLIQKIIRRDRAWIFYFALTILDLDLLLNSVIRVIKCTINSNDTGSDINHMNRLAIRQLVLPTPTVMVAKWVWKYLRREPKLSVKPKPRKALRVLQAYYWDTEHHPPMYDVMETTARELL